jgi:YVTN family beta-propeller protein
MRLFGELLCAALAVLAAGCGDPVGPAGGENPSGDVLVCVNTMSNTIDLYYPGLDSLVSGAYVTGSSPNDARALSGGRLAVVCSLDDRVQLFDLSESGQAVAAADLPGGSNPYAVAESGGMLYVTLLLSGSLAEIDPADMSVQRYLDVADYPSGVAACAGSLWVSHGYGTYDSIGMVSVVDPTAWTVTDTVQTPQNAFSAACAEAGGVHVLTTTYQGDGAVTLIDAETAQADGRIGLGASPSISAVPREWGCGWLLPMDTSGLLSYDQTGVTGTIPTGVPATDVLLADGLLYVASFSEDAIVVLDPASGQAEDTIQTGSGPVRLVLAGGS